jgi:hypothetical protein
MKLKRISSIWSGKSPAMQAKEGRTGDDLVLGVVEDTLELRSLGSLLDDGLDLVAEE